MRYPTLRLAGLALLPLALAGCKGGTETTCAEYLRSADDCAIAAGVLTSEASKSDEAIDTTCARYADLDGDAAQDADDRFACAFAAFDGSDCASVEGYQQAAGTASACLYE